MWTIQCKKAEYIPEECQKLMNIKQLSPLKVSDTLISFWAETSFKQGFQLDTLKGEFTIIFFKNKKAPKKLTILLNKEIVYKDLGKKAVSNKGNLIIANEGKLLKIYGIKSKDNVLILADKNKVIKEIYKNACEEDIIEILNRLRTSPNNGYK